MKRTITTLSGCLIAALTAAQPSDWTWAKTGTGSQPDIANAVAADMQNNVYTIGTFQSPTLVFGSHTLTSANLNTVVPANDFFLLKQDMSGNVLWAISGGGTSDDMGYAVETDASGNVYIAGSSSSSVLTIGTVTLNKNNNSEDYFVAKLDNSGNVLWARTAFGDQQDFARGIAVDTDGNVIIAGHSGSGTLTIGSTALMNDNTILGFAFVAKYDKNGNVLWAKQGLGDGEAYDVDVDPNYNDVFITGFYSSNTVTFGGTTLTNRRVAEPPVANSQGYDVFVVKYDAAGVVNWAKSAGGREDDKGLSIAVAPAPDLYYAGYVYVGGQFTSSLLTAGSATVINQGISGQLEDMFILKYDASGGEAKWAVAMGGANREYLGAIDVVKNAGVVASGSFKSATLSSGTVTATKASGTDNFDVYVAAFTSSGLPVMIETADGNNDDRAHGIAVDQLLNVDIAGYYSSNPLSFDSNVQLSTNNIDMYTAQLSVPELAKMVLADLPDHAISNWTVGPNPGSDVLFISSPGDRPSGARATIYNMIGQASPEIDLSGGAARIDLSGLAPGVYNLVITTETGSEARRIIKN